MKGEGGGGGGGRWTAQADEYTVIRREIKTIRLLTFIKLPSVTASFIDGGRLPVKHGGC